MKSKITHIFPASSLQQGFIYQVLSQEDKEAYREQYLLDINEQLDVDLYIKAWGLCIDKYPILRTAFNWEEDIFQIVYEKGNLDYQIIDISHLKTQEEKENAIKEIQNDDNSKSFDLKMPSVFRVYIIKRDDDKYTILKSSHHIISDGWSTPILFKSLNEFYIGLLNGQPVPVKQDLAYLKAQKYILDNLPEVQKYWDEYISDVTETNDINSFLSKPINLDTYRKIEDPKSLSFELQGDKYLKVKSFCQNELITLNVLIQFVWHKMLQVYSHEPKSIVGTITSGRDLPIEAIEESVGLFVNTLPLVVDWDNEKTIREQLQAIDKKLNELKVKSYANIGALHKGGQRLFHSLFVFQNYPRNFGKQEETSNINVRSIIEKLNYPLIITSFNYSDTLSVRLEYDGVYLSEEKASILLEKIKNIIYQVIENPNDQHHNITLLGDEDKRLLTEFNNTDAEYSKDKTIVQLFEEQVERTPDHIALQFEEETLTYQELNQKANQLARFIKVEYENRAGIEMKADTLVGLCLERSLEMVIGLLGILKAGGAYVPIDPEYPAERIGYIIDDTQTQLILSQDRFKDSLGINADRFVSIELSEGLYEKFESGNLEHKIEPSNLAYVIYTSGTTGKPKGAELTHSGIVNRIEWMQNMYSIGEQDVVLQKTPYVFDVSVWEFFWAHWYGAKLVLARPEGHKDCEYLHDLIEKQKITTLHFVPSMLEVYNQYLISERLSIDNSVRQIICSGEALGKNSVIKAYQNSNSGEFKVHNLYGPTEASIDVTYYETSPDAEVYIGKPIQNTKLYVLDAKLNQVPIGVLGELYIGGVGLAKGYLNKPELTAARFIDNPFVNEEDRAKGYTRIYKTGDIVRWMPDGNIDFVGRNDDQVKINGNRIELGEIQNAIEDIEGIKQSCVLVKERQTDEGLAKIIVGYYVLDEEFDIDNEDEIIKSWEGIYDADYDSSFSELNIESDFVSWNSYITGEPIPISEMEAWRKNIVDNIKKLQPKKVLEVGVGTGLIMFPLIDDVERFVGIDISQNVIQRLNGYFNDKEKDVDFYHLYADQIDQIPTEEKYDTIIINSVCQYFPGFKYFETVLDQALTKLSDSGSIFLGDIRNNDLHKELIKKKLEHNNEDASDHRIESMAIKENELLISPEFFKRLNEKLDYLDINVIERNTTYNNELSQYRYDVVISMNENPVSKGKLSELKIGNSNLHNIPFLTQISKEEITNKLSDRLPEYMVPKTLISMLEFPLTLNGKLDRKALPDPLFNQSENYVAPSSDLEKQLCKIWESILGIERVGIKDDFFNIGGNSILAIRIAHKMSKAMEYDINVGDIFKLRTIGDLIDVTKKSLETEVVKGEEWEI